MPSMDGSPYASAAKVRESRPTSNRVCETSYSVVKVMDGSGKGFARAADLPPHPERSLSNTALRCPSMSFGRAIEKIKEVERRKETMLSVKRARDVLG